MTALPSPFFRLPREIRDQIYAFLFPGKRGYYGQLVDYWGPEDLKVTRSMAFELNTNAIADPMRAISTLAPLCRASKQLLHEATPFYLSTCTVRLECLDVVEFFLAFLDKIGPMGFLAVRTLQIEHFKRIDSKRAAAAVLPYLDLLSRCSNLISLSMKCFGASKVVPRSLVREQTNKLKKYKRSDGYDRRPLWEEEFLHESLYDYIGQTALWRMKVEFKLPQILDLPKLRTLEIHIKNEVNCEIEQGILRALKNWFLESWAEKGQLVFISTCVVCV